ncbi:arginyltransferase [Beggiatoa leptomitoformis]|uniref:Aspartate/glutamate leucyltransferase n=1 Tax=Beggiatoa leptomitoformis TaxID=288004 RepID=A0A2N9YH96_9GAMM|nr:arginyltransferase [Beggiatoa leptomitoformis]ALG67840.1 arginyltransferase [Beggiatoa leptomitoformis]AUI69902.1 arginyltransferase [Beggiatoa leptomitoformis]
MNFRTQFNLYATPPHTCSYLPNRQATTVFIDPHFPKDKALYNTLSQHGFRRSGNHLYRPHCHSCDACVPVRIPVWLFKPNRTQKRIWQKNQDITVKTTASVFCEAHFQLYCRYLAARHAGGGMDNPTRDSYIQFLTSGWADTIFYEFYLQTTLIGVAVVDRFEQGLSAVYTFFDPTPEYTKRSLGVYAVLWEIEECKRQCCDALYLGYWIKDCQKMSYKINYHPLEHYRHGIWQLKP